MPLLFHQFQRGNACIAHDAGHINAIGTATEVEFGAALYKPCLHHLPAEQIEDGNFAIGSCLHMTIPVVGLGQTEAAMVCVSATDTKPKAPTVTSSTYTPSALKETAQKQI